VEWSLLVLGDVEIAAADPRGVLVEYKSYSGQQTLIRLVPKGATFVAEDTVQPARRDVRDPSPPPPFERSSLGKKSRLAWPNGATSIGQYAHLAGWGDRFAIVLDERGFSVIDAEGDRVVRLMMPEDGLRWSFGDPIASAGYVWIAVTGGVVAIDVASLEALAAGSVDVRVSHHHPRRRPEARLACVFLWYLQNGQAMVEIGDGKGGAKEPKLTIELPKVAIAKYAPVVLVDELYPGHYATLEIVGGQRVAIAELARTDSYTAKVTDTRAKDPTGVAKPKPSAVPARRASSGELQRLIATVVANPGDDAPRAVLADLLLELGDPSAEAIAKLRADGKASPARVREALGPLGPYLTKVELVGGFPVAATVTRDAPDVEDHPAELDAACADFRLAMLHALHSQRGRRAPTDVYARLIGAPIATALRRVDVSDKTAIEALIAANRDQLAYLEHVEFAKADWMEQLATPQFDTVATVHAVVGLAHLQPLVNRLLKDRSTFFERAPRRLVLDETVGREAELLRALATPWPKLPIAALTVAGVTIERGGAVTGDDPQLVAYAKTAFA